MTFPMNKTVLLTGGTSMIGRHTSSLLRQYGYTVISPTKEELNLQSDIGTYKYLGDLVEPFGKFPSYIVHLAGWNGGIEWNKKFPYSILSSTLQMYMNLIDGFLPYKNSIYENDVKFISIISSCAYPDFGSEMEEGSLWLGPANKTVECHGHAKRMFDTINRCVKQEYGINAVSAIVNNSFGPYDSFHPDKTKVVGALIRKFVEAKDSNKEKVECWGTGSPLREFIYCKDVASGLVKVMETYDNSDRPINITSGQEISIKGLTEMIAELVGYEGQILWDTTKADGQMRKKLKQSDLNFQITPFRAALAETIEWYKNNKEQADNRKPS